MPESPLWPNISIHTTCLQCCYVFLLLHENPVDDRGGSERVTGSFSSTASWPAILGLKLCTKHPVEWLIKTATKPGWELTCCQAGFSAVAPFSLYGISCTGLFLLGIVIYTPGLYRSRPVNLSSLFLFLGEEFFSQLQCFLYPDNASVHEARLRQNAH